jgi:hypothetical protein
MRRNYKTSLKAVVILFTLLLPFTFYGQTKKDTTFTRYLYINVNGGITQYFGDLNKFDFYNKKIDLAYGFNLGYQISPVLGVRGQFMNNRRPQRLDFWL